MEIKIVIFLNYKNAEKKKDELYCLESEKWLKVQGNEYDIFYNA